MERRAVYFPKKIKFLKKIAWFDRYLTEGHLNDRGMKATLVGTPVVDPQRPVEVLRTIHSLDPCIACAVHVIDREEDEVYVVRAL